MIEPNDKFDNSDWLQIEKMLEQRDRANPEDAVRHLLDMAEVVSFLYSKQLGRYAPEHVPDELRDAVMIASALNILLENCCRRMLDGHKLAANETPTALLAKIMAKNISGDSIEDADLDPWSDE